ncbi:lysophospholipase-like protein 1 [Diorhabda carinulata]|uniref:lysophospholipase-like protein 1 n=1 Tax=Diorhabda carinulata TaxID=1163345 RepID=UPI0025A15CCA|nr:lysophospholipase-like protein 1 [Diorhabda carinulata]
MSLGALHVIKQQKNTCTAAVIFLHGSGDTGQGLLEWVKFLVGDISLPHIKFYFPTAPLRPYTPLNGQLSNVWFDRYNITPDVPEHEETLHSIGKEMNNFITKITNENQITTSRIIIGGFSMGGALALHAAYSYSPGLAGVFTLSSFLNNNSILYKEPKYLKSPLFMCHGERDTMVPISWGKKTFEELTKLGISAEFHPIKNTLHELKKNEILQLLEWIQKILPEGVQEN